MMKGLNKGIGGTDANIAFQSPNEPNDDNDLNQDNESSTSDEPFFVMTLEFEKGKYKKIKIFPSSDPTELAFNFCKENNLDFSSLKFLTKEISSLLTKFNLKQLELFQSNNSIQEVEEEHIQTELTKSPDKNEDTKSHRSAPKLIYSSIDSTNNPNNINDNKEQEAINNALNAKISKEREEKKVEDKENKDDFMNYKEEYYPTNDDNEDIENIKLNLKAHETDEHIDNNKRDEEEKLFKVEDDKQIELDQENTRALLFNKLPQAQSVQSSKNDEGNKVTKPSNTLHSNDNNYDPNPSTRVSQKSKPHPNLSNFQTEDDELAKLIEIKKKKEERARQLQEELENEEKEKQRFKQEQEFLEEQDRLEREEYIQFEKQQAVKIKRNINPLSQDGKKKKLMLNEIEYTWPEEKLFTKPIDINKTNRKDTQKQSVNETTKSNGNGLTTCNNHTHHSNGHTHYNGKLPVHDNNQRLFQYEVLTDHNNISSQRISPHTRNINSTNNKNHQCSTASNLHNPNTNTGMNLINLKKNNFMLLKPEMNLNRCCSANIFEKLYSEAELKRQMPKRPCHFSYRKHPQQLTEIRSMFNSNSEQAHLRINSGDFALKNKYIKTTSKTPSSSSRVQHNPNQRNGSSINESNTHGNITQGNNCKSRPRNQMLQKDNNSYSTEFNVLQTTNGNLKHTSGTGINHSQNKILITETPLHKKDHKEKEKEKKVNSLKLLTKKNLTNPILKKKIEQIKKEFQEKYTFKPKSNNKQCNIETGGHEREDSKTRNNKQKEHNKSQQLNNGQQQRKKEISKGSFISRENNSKSKRKDYNAFNKNTELCLTKTRTNRNIHALMMKHNDISYEPFKCTSESSTIYNKKKEQAFIRLFKQLDDDDDGVISGAHLSTKSLPDNIIELISPILNLIKHGITTFNTNTFISSLNVLYDKMSPNDRRTLLEHLNQKTKKQRISKEKDHKEQLNYAGTTCQYKTFIENKAKKPSNECNNESNKDKKISLSFSHNNLLIKKQLHMQHNSFFKGNIFNELQYPQYDSGKL